MKKYIAQTFGLALIATTAAFAHSGVKDPQVQARMHLMGLVADDMKTLGSMAKGQSEFDQKIVSDRGTQLADHARQIEALFEAQATDPKTEAKDTIWTDWPGFLEKAHDMELAAQAVAGTTSTADFEQAFGALGKTCSACHADYRIKVN